MDRNEVLLLIFYIGTAAFAVFLVRNNCDISQLRMRAEALEVQTNEILDLIAGQEALLNRVVECTKELRELHDFHLSMVDDFAKVLEDLQIKCAAAWFYAIPSEDK